MVHELMLQYTRPSHISSSVTRDEVKRMSLHGLGLFTMTSIIIGFLLTMLNILIAVSFHANDISQTLTDKLGMYFTIKQLPDQQDAVYTRVMHLQKQLEQAGLQSTFSSQDDALQFVEKRVPDLLKKFADYDIQNPFPATLYVTIRGEADYLLLKDLIPRYADVITNTADVAQGRTLQMQEARVVRTIQLSSFVRNAGIVMSLVFAGVVVMIMFFLVKLKFHKFYPLIELKKLLGATYGQIKWPFLLTNQAVIVTSFFCMMVVVGLVDLYLRQFDLPLFFFVDLFELQIQAGSLLNFITGGWTIIIVEFFVLSCAVGLFSSVQLSRMISKVGVNES